MYFFKIMIRKKNKHFLVTVICKLNFKEKSSSGRSSVYWSNYFRMFNMLQIGNKYFHTVLLTLSMQNYLSCLYLMHARADLIFPTVPFNRSIVLLLKWIILNTANKCNRGYFCISEPYLLTSSSRFLFWPDV